MTCSLPLQAFDTIFAKFHEHLSFMLDCVGAASAGLSSNDILQVALLLSN